MRGLIIDANQFEPVITAAKIPDSRGKINKTDIYQACDAESKKLGFAFIATGTGFADKISLVIAVDRNCEKLFGYKVLASNETPGFGDKIKEALFSEQFQQAPAEKLKLVKTGKAKKVDSEIVAISGATVTSQAVVNIFNTYIRNIKENLQKKGLITNVE